MKEDFIAKIEGHGNLTIDWKKGQVKLNIYEGERLFEGMLVDRTAQEMHWITPRICGVCPTAHNLASLNALENALAIKPSRQASSLRYLMQCGQMIQSHTLHLFFLSLPDYLGIDRATELAKKNPPAFKDALALKEVSDMIVDLAGGRHTHPTSSAIGGFYKMPNKEKLEILLDKLRKTRKAAERSLALASKLDYPPLRVELIMAAQEKDSIATVSSISPRKKQFSPVNNYKKDIEEEVRSYSTAKFGKYRGEEMIVGALARLAVYQNYDKKYGLDLANPFHNNLAQAIEILYYYKEAEKTVKSILKGSLEEPIKKPGSKAPFKGIGVIEAPRGGLYHEVILDKTEPASAESLIKEANIITPTVQNLTSIEKSAQALLDQTKNRSRKELERLLVMLVRAYDPCITCSVH